MGTLPSSARRRWGRDAAAGPAIYFIIDAAPDRNCPAACNTSQQFAINLNASAGRAMLTTLLHAQTTMGYSVSATGTEVCDIIADRKPVTTCGWSS